MKERIDTFIYISFTLHFLICLVFQPKHFTGKRIGRLHHVTIETMPNMFCLVFFLIISCYVLIHYYLRKRFR